MKVAVLTIDGRVVCCGPSMTALIDAVRPMAFPAWVDPSFWLQRSWLAGGLETGISFRPDLARPARKLKATWSDCLTPSISRDGTWTLAR